MKIEKVTTESEGQVQTEDKRFTRDLNSKALITTDTTALINHRNRRNKLRAEKDEINNIKAEISEIKNLLYQILDKE